MEKISYQEKIDIHINNENSNLYAKLLLLPPNVYNKLLRFQDHATFLEFSLCNKTCLQLTKATNNYKSQVFSKYQLGESDTIQYNEEENIETIIERKIHDLNNPCNEFDWRNILIQSNYLEIAWNKLYNKAGLM